MAAVFCQRAKPVDDSAPITITDEMVEAAAKAIADGEYEYKRAHNLLHNISMPGPFDDMDYLIPASAWGKVQDDLKARYLRMARAALLTTGNK